MMTRKFRHSCMFVMAACLSHLPLAANDRSQEITAKPISVWERADCPVNREFDRAVMQQNRREADAASATLVHVNAMKRLMNSRKWRNGVSVGEQMTPSESAIFDRETAEIARGMIRNLSESKRSRDIRVLRKIHTLVDQMSRSQLPKATELSEEDKLVLSMMDFISQNMQSDLSAYRSAIIAEERTCDLESSLAIEAFSAVRSIDHQHVDFVNTNMESIKSRYPSPLDISKLNQADAATMSTVKEYMGDIDNKNFDSLMMVAISVMDRISKMGYEARRLVDYSQIKSGSDTNLFNQLAESHFHPQGIEIKMGYTIEFINEKIPTDFQKQMERPH